MTNPSRPRDLIALLLLLLAAGAFCYPLGQGQVLLPDHLLGALPWALERAEGPQHAWNPLQWDALAQYYPWRSFLRENLQAGRLPFWNPHAFCGMPFLANGQSTVLYPFTWLFFLLFPTAFAFGWNAIFHLAVAGGGTYAFLRILGVSRSAALTGAVAYEFCGFLVAWLELPTLVQTAAWLPVGCAGLEQARQRRSVGWAALAGGAVGLAALAGHLQVFLLVGLTVFSFGLFRLATRHHLHLLGIAWALGALIASAQLLPSWELARHSHRPGWATEESYRSYLGRALPLHHSITAFLPNYFGNPTQGNYWGLAAVPLPDGRIAWTRNPADYIEFCIYMGVLTLYLSLYALLFRRGRTTFYLTGLLLFSTLLAFGGWPNRFFFFHVPGFASAGGPCRIVLLGLFASAILTGLGLEQWQRDVPMGRWKRGLAVAGVLGGTFGISWAFAADWAAVLETQIPLRRTPIAGDLVHLGVFALLGLGVLGRVGGKGRGPARKPGEKKETRILCLSALFRSLPSLLVPLILYADLWCFGHAFNPTSSPAAAYPPSRLADRLRAQAGWARVLPRLGPWSLTRPPQPILPPNSSMALGLYDVQGYDSLYLREYKEWMNLAEGGEASPPENGNILRLTRSSSPLLDLLGVRYVVSSKELSEPGLRPLWGEVFRVYENRRALPRAWVVHRAEAIPDRQALRARLLSPGFEARQTVLLETPTGLEGPESSASGSRAFITRYEANRAVLSVTLAAPGYVVLSDVAFPGWKAYVDGQTGRWEQADGFLRAVALPPGAHTVAFVYQPMAVRLGLFGLSLGMLGFGGVAGRTLGRRLFRPRGR